MARRRRQPIATLIDFAIMDGQIGGVDRFRERAIEAMGQFARRKPRRAGEGAR